MRPGISQQQRNLLTMLAAPPPPGWKSADYPRPAWPVRELRRAFMPNGVSQLSEVKAIEQAEHSTRRALRALKKRGLIEVWDAVFEPRILGAKVTWLESSEHVPGRTERMRGFTLTEAGLDELAKP
jgi:hypothetical protein